MRALLFLIAMPLLLCVAFCIGFDPAMAETPAGGRSDSSAVPCAVDKAEEWRGGLTLSLPAGDAIYEELEHFQALGLLDMELADRPLNRRDLLRALTLLDSAPPVAPAERLRLERLRDKLVRWNWLRERSVKPSYDDTRAVGPPDALWEAGLGLSFRGGPASVDSLPDVNRRPRRDGMLFLSLNAELDARLSVELRFYEDYSRLSPYPNSGDWVDNTPVDFRGLFTDPSARLDRAVIAWDADWLRLRLGREDRRMGRGAWGSLFLSENPFPLDGFSLRLRGRYIGLHSLVAQSRRGSMNVNSGDEADFTPRGDAWIAAHRLQIDPPGPLSLGLFEAAAWGGRGIDPAYANPIGFLVAMSQDIFDHSGTDDKKVVGMDFRLSLAPVSLYGEFLLDRLVALDKAEAGDAAEISSFAQLVGLRWAAPFGLAGADLNLEYAHLDPQVYFHHDGDPRRALATEDRLGEGALLGHWLGPNADGFFARLVLPPWRRLGRLSCEFQHIRRGLVDGLTGLEMGFISMRKGEKKWITGEVASERIYRLHWRAPLWRPALLPGSFATSLSLARVERGGSWPEAESDERRSGWLLELRLDWRALTGWGDGWRRGSQ